MVDAYRTALETIRSDKRVSIAKLITRAVNEGVHVFIQTQNESEKNSCQHYLNSLQLEEDKLALVMIGLSPRGKEHLTISFKDLL